MVTALVGKVYPSTCPTYQWLARWVTDIHPGLEVHSFFTFDNDRFQNFRLCFYVHRQGRRAELHDFSFLVNGRVDYNHHVTSTNDIQRDRRPFQHPERDLSYAEAIQLIRQFC